VLNGVASNQTESSKHRFELIRAIIAKLEFDTSLRNRDTKIQSLDMSKPIEELCKDACSDERDFETEQNIYYVPLLWQPTWLYISVWFCLVA